MRLILTISLVSFLSTFQAQFKDSIQYTNFWTANRNAMISLTAWSAANIASSITLTHQTVGDAKYFQQMNGMWNAVNLGLAIPGWIKCERKLKYPSLETWDVDKIKLPKVYKVNFFLDFVYIGAGTTMSLIANRSNQPEMMKGFGNSILLQGGYLFAFDLIMWQLLKKKTTLSRI